MAKALKLTAAAFGLGAGGYAGQAYYHVYHAEQEQSRHERLVRSHADAVSSLQASIQKNEAQAEMLLRQRHQQLQSVAEVDKQLTAAREEVLRLEDDRNAKETELRQTEAKAIELRTSTSKVQQDLQQKQQAVTAAQQAIKQAQQQVVAARSQLNPLNHPLVKELMSR
ncbi:hypothetical protein WJX72_007144 [[Myrmecia] bisecta]|uniref:Uncharacterized protein n=1 Tax=[Myrmecia] bisecta TaxID=41462 RepID=A0AAW1P8T4_9CHLO